MDERRNGLMFAFAAAMVSGVSVFLNKSALAFFPDPFGFTGLKNLFVAIFLASGILLFSRNELLRISKNDLRNLIIIGIIGGSIPFMLFFWGLSQGNAPNSSLLQKTLFIPASALAFLFLKERLSVKQILGAILLFVGAALLSGITPFSLSIGEFAILAAVALWSIEDIISKAVLKAISTPVVVLGRMLFGSLVVLAYVTLTSGFPNLLSLSAEATTWLLLTVFLLLGYNLAFYSGLKRLKVGESTSILVIGSFVTTILSALFAVQPIALCGIVGMFAIAAGAGLIAFFPEKEKQPVTLSS